MKHGLDIGGTKVAGVAMDDDGAEVATARRALPRGDYDGTIAAVAATVREIEAATGCAASRIGVCVSGNVQADGGAVKLGTLTWIQGRPFRDDIAAATGAEVRMANDADCFALSEAADGAGAGARSVFGLILGTGVGGGFVHDGRLVTGKRGIAGEIGHIPLPGASAAELAASHCSCGRVGCVEALLSGGAMAREFRALTGREATDARAVAELADAGDAEARAAWDRYEERLGRLIGLIVNMLEPDVVVLGGGVSNVRRIYAGAAAQMAQHVFGGVCDTRLVQNARGDSSGVRGAARLWDH